MGSPSGGQTDCFAATVDSFPIKGEGASLEATCGGCACQPCMSDLPGHLPLDFSSRRPSPPGSWTSALGPILFQRVNLQVVPDPILDPTEALHPPCPRPDRLPACPRCNHCPHALHADWLYDLPAADVASLEAERPASSMATRVWSRTDCCPV